VLALTLVIGVILVAARLWKKHGPIPAAGLPPEALELLGQRQIGSHHSIFLVRLGARVLVLGSATEGLRTLAEVNNPVDVDLLCGLCRGSARSDGVSHAFRSLFQKHLGPKPRTTSPRTGSTRQFPERQPEEVHA
jgi:flagellar biogenesis protein FliO